MTKKACIVLILILGFFLIPSVNHACSNSYSKNILSNEKSSCSKKCCVKDSKKGKHNSSGKCCNSGCHNSTLQFSILNSNTFDLKNDAFNFSLKNNVSYYNETNVSDGFAFIWLRPKIK
ncbi:hypothetical protein DMB65_15330 [Flavobacterium cheongpyeongense]|uniref:Uncharacterized protein n=1 Tax=Flavobacterium cheongpyeongense TaxID=2212651 RepID=A0A2V4BQG7_9FLAO|nr:hypothetical protein [Flavobacterium cheongpyeongense]PXY39890.1 hypothetical protein DMB65_15330 [Flavobacterium cheongpyeongense]